MFEASTQISPLTSMIVIAVATHTDCRIPRTETPVSTTTRIAMTSVEGTATRSLINKLVARDNVAAENKNKEMLRLCSVRCPHMNEITLEDTRDALLHDRYVIEVPEDIRVRAKRALDRMLEMS